MLKLPELCDPCLEIKFLSATKILINTKNKGIKMELGYHKTKQYSSTSHQCAVKEHSILYFERQFKKKTVLLTQFVHPY